MFYNVAVNWKSAGFNFNIWSGSNWQSLKDRMATFSGELAVQVFILWECEANFVNVVGRGVFMDFK